MIFRNELETFLGLIGTRLLLGLGGTHFIRAEIVSYRLENISNSKMSLRTRVIRNAFHIGSYVDEKNLFHKNVLLSHSRIYENGEMDAFDWISFFWSTLTFFSAVNVLRRQASLRIMSNVLVIGSCSGPMRIIKAATSRMAQFSE